METQGAVTRGALVLFVTQSLAPRPGTSLQRSPQFGTWGQAGRLHRVPSEALQGTVPPANRRLKISKASTPHAGCCVLRVLLAGTCSGHWHQQQQQPAGQPAGQSRAITQRALARLCILLWELDGGQRDI